MIQEILRIHLNSNLHTFLSIVFYLTGNSTVDFPEFISKITLIHLSTVLYHAGNGTIDFPEIISIIMFTQFYQLCYIIQETAQ